VRRQNVSPWVYVYASAGMKTKKNMGNNIRSSPLSVTCNRSFAACLVKHHANDCNPEGILARRIAASGRELTDGPPDTGRAQGPPSCRLRPERPIRGAIRHGSTAVGDQEVSTTEAGAGQPVKSRIDDIVVLELANVRGTQSG
jgi:hypothetical protein